MYTLNAKSREHVFEATGMTLEQIANMDFEDIDKFISQKVKHKIKDYILDERLVGRGQVYSHAKRFITMEEVDRNLKKNDRRKSAFVKRSISKVQRSH